MIISSWHTGELVESLVIHSSSANLQDLRGKPRKWLQICGIAYSARLVPVQNQWELKPQRNRS